jgi:hypothetical protein
MMRGRAPTTQPPLEEEEELDPEAAIEKDSLEAESSAEQAIGADIPPMAEQLRPDTMSKLSAILPAAMERLTQGQVPATQVRFPTESDPSVESLPPAAGKWLMAVGSMVETFGASIPGLEQFAIAPQELTTNDGIIGAAMKVDALSRDSKLVAAIAKGPAAGAPKQSPPKAAPTAAQE